MSRQRADQLWMLVGMFDRAVGREEMPGRASQLDAVRERLRHLIRERYPMGISGRQTSPDS
ncbi:hypothetical protein [Streptomyces jeddahensis]|uniref:hypothetical protein n=1 Tax=Streptomyces jeddahensis TaxID=1716141 RepID=UPI0012FF922D|nr:hypothetical protein [Streptomyces jeddahensis]